MKEDWQLTDEERVNRVLSVMAEIGGLRRQEERNVQDAMAEGDESLCAYCAGMAEAYRIAWKMLHKAFHPEYPEDAL